MKEIAPLFILGLVAGYNYLNNCKRTEWQADRIGGQRLVFESAWYGAIFTFLAILFCVGIYQALSFFHFDQFKECVDSVVTDFPHVKPICIFITALVFSWLGWVLVNWYMSFIGSEQKFTASLVEKKGTILEKLLNYALENERLVAFTLSNHKVYIGWTLEAIDLAQNNDFIEIQAVYSGFRNSETQKMTLTTSYQLVLEFIRLREVIEGNENFKVAVEKEKSNEKDLIEAYQEIPPFNPRDFCVTIRTSEIVHANIYDLSFESDDFDMRHESKDDQENGPQTTE